MKIKELIKLEIIKARSIRLSLILLLYFIISTAYFYVYFHIMAIAKILKNKDFTDFFLNQNYTVAVLFFAIITVIFIGADFNKNIYAKQFISGISKNDFIVGKILFILGFAVFVVFAELIKFFLIQYILTKQIQIDLKIVFKIIFGFYMVLVLAGVYAFLSITILKKTILSAVALYLIYKAEIMFEFYEKIHLGDIVSSLLPFHIILGVLGNIVYDSFHYIMLFFYFLISVFLIYFIINKNEIIINK